MVSLPDSYKVLLLQATKALLVQNEGMAPNNVERKEGGRDRKREKATKAYTSKSPFISPEAIHQVTLIEQMWLCSWKLICTVKVMLIANIK